MGTIEGFEVVDSGPVVVAVMDMQIMIPDCLFIVGLLSIPLTQFGN